MQDLRENAQRIEEAQVGKKSEGEQKKEMSAPKCRSWKHDEKKKLEKIKDKDVEKLRSRIKRGK